MSVTVLNHQTVGSELSLKCNVTTVRGLTSNVEIVWMTTSGTEVGELNDSRISISPTESSGSIHTSTLQFSYLSEDDDKSVYICSAAIHEINASRSVELNDFQSELLQLMPTDMDAIKKLACYSYCSLIYSWLLNLENDQYQSYRDVASEEHSNQFNSSSPS